LGNTPDPVQRLHEAADEFHVLLGELRRVSAVTRAETLTEAVCRADELRADLTRRGVHADVLRFCRAELVADNYFHTVMPSRRRFAMNQLWFTIA
jgi:hypothetical protein